MNSQTNPYLREVHQNLPRLLGLFNQDRTSASYGFGDRYHWAWGLIDFGNGTFQGAAHGLARLVGSKLLPDSIDEGRAIDLIQSMFVGAKALCRRDGSMEEAFPFEGSFCVTALVAYDLLSAVELLDEHLTEKVKESYLEIIRPMVDFLHRHDETHALISNHLATAVAALFKWSQLSGGGTDRAQEILDRILKNQSAEGWFREYEGADPGYQSLATYYLADIHRMKPDLGLLEPLRKSLAFLWHFAHPDGSFGGIYGSRNTRFYYPAGIEYLAEEVPEAAALAAAMRESIASCSVVTLSGMDEPNLVPMFNAYAWAACLKPKTTDRCIPSRGIKSFRRQFDEAGIMVDRGESHYTILGLSKGGVVYHFPEGGRRLIDCGVVVRSRRGGLSSSQNWSNHTISISDGTVEITSELFPMQRQETTPLKYIALRLLCMSVMRNAWIREKVKQMLVKMLITRRESAVGLNRRRINLGRSLNIEDNVDITKSLERLADPRSFVAIHMASQGYWQESDTSREEEVN